MFYQHTYYASVRHAYAGWLTKDFLNDPEEDQPLVDPVNTAFNRQADRRLDMITRDGEINNYLHMLRWR